MDHPWIMIMQVVKRFKNLLSVHLNNCFMERLKAGVLALQRMRHVLHYDPLLALASFCIFLIHTSIVLDDVLMSEASQKFLLMLKLGNQKLVLCLDNFDRQLRRNIEFSWRISSVCLIRTLENFSKGSLPKHMTFLDWHELLLPNLIDFNLFSVIQTAILTIYILDRVHWV